VHQVREVSIAASEGGEERECT